MVLQQNADARRLRGDHRRRRRGGDGHAHRRGERRGDDAPATVERDAGGRPWWQQRFGRRMGSRAQLGARRRDAPDCASARAVALRNVTFGEVCLCAGRSNAWRSTYYAFERNGATRRRSILPATDAPAPDLVLAGRRRVPLRRRARVGRAAPPPYNPVGGFPTAAGCARPTACSSRTRSRSSRPRAGSSRPRVGDAERARHADAGEPEAAAHADRARRELLGRHDDRDVDAQRVTCRVLADTTVGPPDQRDDYANGALFNGMVAPWVPRRSRASSGTRARTTWASASTTRARTTRSGRSPAACGAAATRRGGGPTRSGLRVHDRGARARLARRVARARAAVRHRHARRRHVRGPLDVDGRVPPRADRGLRRPAVRRAAAHLRRARARPRRPVDGRGRARAERDAPWACQRDADNSNDGPFTKFFMGAIHPRAKPALGRRLALGARAMSRTASPGSSTRGRARACAVVDGGAGGVRVDFDAARLGDADAVRVWKAGLAVEDTDALLARCGDLGAPACSSFGYTSPMEVQYDGRVRARGARARARARVSPILAVVRFDATRVVSEREAPLPRASLSAVAAGRAPAAARARRRRQPHRRFRVGRALHRDAARRAQRHGRAHAWSDVPCCPVQERDVTPCPLYGARCTALLAAPGGALHREPSGPDGKCDRYISTLGPAGAWGA